jgi:hypothetical protein
MFRHQGCVTQPFVLVHDVVEFVAKAGKLSDARYAYAVADERPQRARCCPSVVAIYPHLLLLGYDAAIVCN